MNKRVTLADVAEHAGVSRATASLVIRGAGNLAESTRERVRSSMLALGYVWTMVWSRLFFGEPLNRQKIAGVMFAAMVVNLVAAALAGVTVPLVLKRLGVDPAVAGGVVVTTVTDVVGFAALLGLGTLVLL